MYVDKTVAALALTILLLGGTAFYFYRETMALRADPAAQSAREVAALVARVATHIELPQGETPTVATVNDPEKLTNQPFFTQAKKGDKVLLYTGVKRAYLYDPVADKLLDVAPLTIGSQTSSH